MITMPGWSITLLGCILGYAVLLIGNMILTPFLINDAAWPRLGDNRPMRSPSRWYLLFFATHEVLAGIAGRSRLTRFAFMLAVVGIAFLFYLISKPYGDAVWAVLTGSWILFGLGFAVTRLR